MKSKDSSKEKPNIEPVLLLLKDPNKFMKKVNFYLFKKFSNNLSLDLQRALRGLKEELTQIKNILDVQGVSQ